MLDIFLHYTEKIYTAQYCKMTLEQKEKLVIWVISET